ncbi:hypothetical protein FZEAL_8960 [Fusarium zealandicum]|uniref:Haloacid dehalogenase n=1 Tax=Fusarium zealandicum TaxID=1053134 RepID=A0A8H4UDR3_9HYPO|nr:hypothetical protein FZEAL_8960 [Fusarium zealandicum]
MTQTVIAFDLYGTLLSTESIAKELAHLYGDDKAKVIASQARRYQLEYTWRLNSMGTYRPFSDLTRWSFRQATKEAGVELTSEQEERIMDRYNGLDTFPDVKEALETLANSPSLDPYVFSNGTISMIASSLETSPSLGSASHVLSSSKIVSVDTVKVFKPDPRTYQAMTKAVNLESQPEKVWLVSSNPFDVVGAMAAGLKSVWVDRGGSKWIDGLGSGLKLEPTIVVSGVDEAVREILLQSGSGSSNYSSADYLPLLIAFAAASLAAAMRTSHGMHCLGLANGTTYLRRWCIKCEALESFEQYDDECDKVQKNPKQKGKCAKKIESYDTSVSAEACGKCIGEAAKEKK